MLANDIPRTEAAGIPPVFRMAMNSLRKLAVCLEPGGNEIHVREDLRRRAVRPIVRLLDFAQARSQPTRLVANEA